MAETPDTIAASTYLRRRWLDYNGDGVPGAANDYLPFARAVRQATPGFPSMHIGMPSVLDDYLTITLATYTLSESSGVQPISSAAKIFMQFKYTCGSQQCGDTTLNRDPTKNSFEVKD